MQLNSFGHRVCLAAAVIAALLTRPILGYALAYRTHVNTSVTFQYSYDALGNWTTCTNAEGRVFSMAYDARNRPLTTTNALGQQLFQNSYDPVGNLTNRVDGAGNFNVIQIKLPTSTANSFMRTPRLDGIGTARYGELDALNAVKPVIKVVQ